MKNWLNRQRIRHLEEIEDFQLTLAVGIHTPGALDTDVMRREYERANKHAHRLANKIDWSKS